MYAAHYSGHLAADLAARQAAQRAAHSDPWRAPFCLALIATAPSPRDAARAFAQRLLARNAAQV